MVNMVLGQSKSGGCFFSTLRFGINMDLSWLRWEKGKLFTPNFRGIVRQA